MDREKIEAEFNRLLQDAKTKNEMYYTFNLLGWGGRGRSMHFMAEINRLTNEVLLDRARPGGSQFVAAHEALFVLVTNLEAKEFYAAIRNFESIVSGRRVSPFPWDSNLGEQRTRGKIFSLSTGRIIDNLIADLRRVGYADLADEFHYTHHDIGAKIRNAAAHATFLAPSITSNNMWVFADYAVDSNGKMKIVEHEMTEGDFNAFARRFFEFRLAFFRAYNSHSDSMKAAGTFTFLAENQMKKGEMLHCTVDEEGTRIGIKYQGTPPW